MVTIHQIILFVDNHVFNPSESLVHPCSAPMARYANLGAPPPTMPFNPSLQPQRTPQGITFKLRTPLNGEQVPSTQIFGPSFGAFFDMPHPVHHTQYLVSPLQLEDHTQY